ncbi:MAG: TasA family protein, partial [bacterium]
MKKILISLSVIGAIAAIIAGATVAFFSDSETSVGNTFTAGAIDLQIDSMCSYNGEPNPECTWQLADLTDEKLFDYDDVKPGDQGENTISLHVFDNDAWACVTITPVRNDDMSSTEPELAVDVEENPSDSWDGELAENMDFMVWADICSPQVNQAYPNALPGDNEYQPDCDRLLTSGHGFSEPTTWALADSQNENVFTGVLADPL